MSPQRQNQLLNLAEPLVGDDTKAVPSELMLPLFSQVTGQAEKGSL